MIRSRHRLLASLAAVVALAVASQASASSLLQLAYSNAKTFGNVHIAGGAIDLTSGAMIVTTSAFGFVPSGGQANEYGTPGVAEYGIAAIHDAIVEGANIAGGFWDGTNGIKSSTAATWGNADQGIYFVDNSFVGLSSFRGIPVTADQTIIATTWLGDGDLNGIVNADDRGLWSGYLTTGTTLYGGPVESVDGDFDYSGLVNADDRGVWSGTLTLGDGQTTINGETGTWYGAIVPSNSAPVGVPEPGTVALLFFTAIAGALYHFVRRTRG
jgi:hypothetical protein